MKRITYLCRLTAQTLPVRGNRTDVKSAPKDTETVIKSYWSKGIIVHCPAVKDRYGRHKQDQVEFLEVAATMSEMKSPG